jgi:hypothetical protein
MNKNQKIVIQSFGLQAVQVLEYSGVIAGLVLGEELGSNRGSDYNGKLPQAPQGDTPLTMLSDLGTPMWDNLVIQGDTYTDTNTGNAVTYPNVTLNTILITMTQQDNVVLTPIQGRNGEVVEYISSQSWRINFKGGVFGNGNSRPFADIENLKKMLNSNKPLIVKFCGFLGEWDISEIVKIDKSIPQNMGGYNYQLFEFNAIENIPVILAQQQAQ